MRAGKMRHRITLTTRTLAVDAFGQQIETWASPVTVWAEVMQLPVGEQQAYEVTEQKSRINIFMRYLAGVSTSSRVAYAGLDYNIVSVINLEGRNATIEMSAERIV